MSDDKPTADAEPTKAEPTKEVTAKTYSEDDFKKVIADRDKAKEKARKFEEAQAKVEEAEALKRGEHEKLLAEQKKELETLRSFKAIRDEEEAKEREELTGKLSDDDKEIATEIATLSKLRKFVEKQTTAPALNQGKGAKEDTSKEHLAPKPGESATDYNMRVMRQMQSQH